MARLLYKPPNETVETLYFQVDRKADGGAIALGFAVNAGEQEYGGFDQCPKGVDLADIAQQGEQSR